ncbi:NUDIX hydrolase domain-like protein [Armillaria mellea]|nr:NUDIX hydrolase domain-like protein [Armillaria mellea]
MSLSDWTDWNQAAVARLKSHGIQNIDLSTFPSSSLAAVLVLLYEDAGQLRVLLTTRSKLLRTHAGQTALPGGRVDDTDKGLTHTAYREAHEEVGLPLDCPYIETLCTFEPFLSLHRLLVTPVVALLTDNSILDGLTASEGEVSRIFSHPLEALLDPIINTTDSLVPLLGNSPYRMHRFRSTASPVKGLTSDILISIAQFAFNKPPTYERYAPGQPHGFREILAIVQEHMPSNAKSA